MKISCNLIPTYCLVHFIRLTACTFANYKLFFVQCYWLLSFIETKSFEGTLQYEGLAAWRDTHEKVQSWKWIVFIKVWLNSVKVFKCDSYIQMPAYQRFVLSPMHGQIACNYQVSEVWKQGSQLRRWTEDCTANMFMFF